jgi:hypothetical protein
MLPGGARRLGLALQLSVAFGGSILKNDRHDILVKTGGACFAAPYGRSCVGFYSCPFRAHRLLLAFGFLVGLHIHVLGVDRARHANEGAGVAAGGNGGRIVREDKPHVARRLRLATGVAVGQLVLKGRALAGGAHSERVGAVSADFFGHGALWLRLADGVAVVLIVLVEVRLATLAFPCRVNGGNRVGNVLSFSTQSLHLTRVLAVAVRGLERVEVARQAREPQRHAHAAANGGVGAHFKPLAFGARCLCLAHCLAVHRFIHVRVDDAPQAGEIEGVGPRCSTIVHVLPRPAKALRQAGALPRLARVQKPVFRANLALLLPVAIKVHERSRRAQ